MSRVKFKEAIGPGKCTRCGIYIHGDERMWIAENLSGRPSLTKQQKFNYEPQFCQKCYENFNK